MVRAFVEALAHAERSPEFRVRLRDHYRRARHTIAALVADALGPEVVDQGADPDVIALYIIAVFDGLAVQSRLAPEDTPSGDELVSALGVAIASPWLRLRQV